ncbi:MAG: bacteriocin family protein [Candidatus Atribacteria bacterium]|nr:bacteriocin family protein [Candidatus Atribacteria bacterium]
MDILKRNLAPITDQAWKEIDRQAKKVLHNQLTARQFVDVIGPKGWDYAGVGLGRLNVPENQREGEVRFGIHMIQPLVEIRTSFQLDLWELDNINRGAVELEFTPLIDAAKQTAFFEEKAIYHGFEPGDIDGILPVLEYEPLPFSHDPGEFLGTAAEATVLLSDASVEGPYALLINPLLWADLASMKSGYPLNKAIENIVNAKIIPVPVLEDALLVSTRGGDFELTLGQDLSIGYENHDDKYVNLFFTESFTFRVLDPSVFVRLVSSD